ncbi:ISAs1 family transposase [Bradyrhizobium vignae]|uniref:ISAs1 family transposase n=1 Tax=Bradyrhizobium vignae TaxID=1549949 RepID=UPI001FDEBE28|nr:ISAs1 family transposase [Bradyrhizobium vignae]
MAKQYDFPAIAAIGRIDSWRANSGKAVKHTVRYFLASRLLSAKKLLEVVRAHWSIENNLHWVLDVLFDEDACRSRKDHAAENLALIRKLAINTLQATPGPARISHKMLQARWNNDFLLSALAICDNPTWRGRVASHEA